MELDEALSQISEIRRTLARSRVFRGYGARPTAACSLLALAAAAVQAAWLPTPQETLGPYLSLWIGAAAVGFSLSLVDVWYRYRHSPLSLWREDAWLALEQFLPSIGAGAAVTWTLVCAAPGVVWLLPGLWSVLFGLGLAASGRMLPRAVQWIAAWYVVAGCAAMCLFRHERSLSPWAMVLTFGVGLAAASATLAASERRDPRDVDDVASGDRSAGDSP